MVVFAVDIGRRMIELRGDTLWKMSRHELGDQFSGVHSRQQQRCLVRSIQPDEPIPLLDLSAICPKIPDDG